VPGNKRDRDRATNAFRRWALLGSPSRDQIKNVKGAEDLRACAAVFAQLALRPNGAEIAAAVRAVYMEESWRPIRKAEVTMRVRRAAWELHADERTVYRWLGTARKLWTMFRDNSGKTCQ